eukprot:668577-Hanusia_phi.AAC.2
MKTWLAACRFSPSPPALKLMRIACNLVSLPPAPSPLPYPPLSLLSLSSLLSPLFSSSLSPFPLCSHRSLRVLVEGLEIRVSCGARHVASEFDALEGGGGEDVEEKVEHARELREDHCLVRPVLAQLLKLLQHLLLPPVTS